MKVGVCMKRVPDTEARITIAGDSRTIDESGVEFIINPYDEIAVEVGLRLKEKHGGEVVMVCYGPEGSGPVIRKALAMGADRAVHIVYQSAEHEPYQAARVLATALEEEKFDVILCGKQAVDDDSAQVGPMLAELLGMPCVTEASALEVDGDKVVVHKEIEGGEEVVEATLPAIVTCQKGIAEPRLPGLKGIMMSKKKPLAEKKVDEPGLLTEVIRLEYPPTRPPGRIVGEGVEAVGALIEALKSEAKVL